MSVIGLIAAVAVEFKVVCVVIEGEFGCEGKSVSVTVKGWVWEMCGEGGCCSLEEADCSVCRWCRG